MYIVSLAHIECKTLNCDMIILNPYVKTAQTKLKITSNFDIKSIWFLIVCFQHKQKKHFQAIFLGYIRSIGGY
jgi:hypothetical protein